MSWIYAKQSVDFVFIKYETENVVVIQVTSHDLNCESYSCSKLWGLLVISTVRRLVLYRKRKLKLVTPSLCSFFPSLDCHLTTIQKWTLINEILDNKLFSVNKILNSAFFMMMTNIYIWLFSIFKWYSNIEWDLLPDLYLPWTIWWFRRGVRWLPSWWHTNFQLLQFLQKLMLFRCGFTYFCEKLIHIRMDYTLWNFHVWKFWNLLIIWPKSFVISSI